MERYRVIAKGDLEKDRHTWKQGLDYELVEKNDSVLLASDQGHIRLRQDEKEKLSELFEGVQGLPKAIGTNESA